MNTRHSFVPAVEFAGFDFLMFSLMQVDLFFYREPEEAKQEEEDEVPAPDYAIADFNAAANPIDGQWPAAIDQSWSDAAPQPIPAVPAVNWAAPEAGTQLCAVVKRFTINYKFLNNFDIP